MDLAHDGEHVVRHAQPPVPDPTGLPMGSVGDAPSAHGRVDAECHEFAAESREVMRVHTGRVDAGAQPVLEAAASGAQMEFPDRRGHAPGLFRHEGVQPVFMAQPVADLPPFAQGSLPQAHDLAGDPVGRADEDVVVHMRPVGVGGDHVVVRASGDLPDEPFPDQMRQSGRDRVGGIERLDHMQRQHGSPPARAAFRGVQRTFEAPGDGLGVRDVVADGGRRPPVAVGLPGVRHVRDAAGERAFDLANLDYSHSGTPLGSTSVSTRMLRPATSRSAWRSSSNTRESMARSVSRVVFA